MSAFNQLLQKLEQLSRNKYKFTYKIPKIWDDIYSNEKVNIEVHPYQFYLKKVNEIIELSKNYTFNPEVQISTDKQIVYNMLVRYTTAFDHDEDGFLNLQVDDKQFKETGTFLKAIAILPYIKSLGVNIIHLLPITSIGIDGKKGNLGSPYAIRNAYKLDENLNEHTLGLEIEILYAAFVEACHLLDIRVINEFVFRTASVDNELALEYPEWFYWIKAKIKDREADSQSEAQYGSPIFLKKELKLIKEKVEAEDFTDTIPPHEQYRQMFTNTPKKVARVENRILGVLNKTEEVRIPSAFADWPPDDIQPAWSDVTYFKMFEHPDFNYIAYNTIRMYDEKLQNISYWNNDLWEYLAEIIPYYQDKFKIDGVMIDMGHALPPELLSNIIKKAKANRSNFIFWEENFHPNAKSKSTGYDAVMGYMVFDAYKADGMRQIVRKFEKNEFEIPFFASAENHNTPRAITRVENKDFPQMIYAFSAFLPTISFIHSGFELMESNPVNTGLDFTPEQIQHYDVEKLALFSAQSLDWNNEANIISSMRFINEFKSKLEFLNPEIELLELFKQNVIAFTRKLVNDKLFIALANFTEESNEVKLPFESKFKNLLTDDVIESNEFIMSSWECKLFIQID